MSTDTPQDAGPVSRQDFERDIVLRARTDPDFRAALVADPRTALLEVYGVEILPDVDLQVLQETPSQLYMVLPLQTDELTDEELAAVAGGAGSPMAARLTATAAAGMGEFVRR